MSPATVILTPKEQRRSSANPPAAQASWFLLCWGFVANVWRSVKKGVEDGAKAIKNSLADFWGSFKKGVCIACKATNDAARFVNKKVKWALEESLILYERADSYWIPPHEVWWVNFIKETKLPALKEVVREDTRIHMRIIWLVVFIAAFWNASYYLSVDAYKLYEKHPIQFTLQPHETDVGEIPFPSISLSWANNLKTTFLNSVEDALAKIPTTGTEAIEGIEFNIAELSILAQILLAFCEPKVSWRTALKFPSSINLFSEVQDNLSPVLDVPDSELLAKKIVPTLQKAGTYCSRKIAYCAWNGVEVPCSEMFKPALTETGISCVFNKMPVSLMRRNRSLQTLINGDKLTNEEETLKWKYWNLEKISNPGRRQLNSNLSDVPLTQKSAKKISGAAFVINTDEGDSTCPQFDTSGPRVSLSFPLDDHNHETEHFVVSPNNFVKVNVFPELITADKDIKEVKKEKRACLFPSEGSLEYYTTYTEVNCKKECLANFIRKKFNCSLLSMPNTNGTRLCNFKEVTAVLYAEEQNRSDECIPKCLPTCNSLSYKTDAVVERLTEETVDSLKQCFNFTASVVHVSFEKENVIAKLRSLRHSIFDFIGLIGGFFGTVLNLSYLNLARLTFAGWFLLPPLTVLIKLIIRSLLWIILLVCCCCQARKKVTSEDNGSTVNDNNNDPAESPTETSDVVVVMEENEVENIFTSSPTQTPNLQNL